MTTIATSKELPTGTVTFLFTDVEGSTRLLQQVGDRYRDVLELHHDILRSAIESHRGMAVSTEGDSFFAVFISADDAVDAAVSAQERLFSAEWPADAVVRVRMGLHTGRGELGADNYVGLDVHVGARVSAAAHGGQVVMSRATEALVSGRSDLGMAVRNLGTHILKDIDREISLYQVTPPGLPSDFPPLETMDTRPNNLPVQTTPFIGREHELADISRVLAASRLVTLTGPGGVGKTRLALHAAARAISAFRDGVRYVQLGPVRSPTMVAATIAQALGVAEQSSDIDDLIVEYLRSSEMLMVLDTFEHLLPAAPKIAGWLEQAAGLKVIVTSRATLRLRGEHEYPVPPFQVPAPGVRPTADAVLSGDAVDLFVRRARTVQPDFVLSEANVGAVAEIVNRLDGLPLAIELAASRLKMFTPEHLLERLKGQLDVLKGGRDLPDRQQTMRQSIEWSCELLNEEERACFRRLSVFIGGFTVEAAERVVGDDLDVLEAVAGLIDQSLLRTTPMQGRIEMLRTVRDHASHMLEASGERDEMKARHVDWAVALAREAEPHLTLAQRVQWLERLDTEHDNIRTAVRWAVSHEWFDRAAAIVNAMWRFWQVRGLFFEGRQAARAVLDLPGGEAPTKARANLLLTLGNLTYWQGEWTEATDLYEQASALSEEIGDEAGVGEALFNLSFSIGLDERGTDRADELTLRAIARFEAAGDRRRLALMAAPRAFSLLRRGLVDEASAIVDDAHAYFVSEGDDFGRAIVLSVRAGIAARTGGRSEAAHAAGAALDLFEEVGDVASIAALIALVGYLTIVGGAAVEGGRLIGAADGLRAEVGSGLVALTEMVGDPVAEAAAFIAPADYHAAVADGERLGLWEALAEARHAVGQFDTVG